MLRPLSASIHLIVALAFVSWAASATPTITVMPERPFASEIGPAPGVFTLQRTGDTGDSLSVSFTLGGTAAAGQDYLVWETPALFEPGSNVARVAVLPRNDTVAEGSETVLLTLSPGGSYLLGTPSSAEVTIADVSASGRPGVFDSADPDPVTGGQMLSGDIAYLDAWVQDGRLEVEVSFTDPIDYLSILNLNLYVDADRDPMTGDYRPGRLGGQEYRVNIDQLSQTWFAYRLRTAPPVPLAESEKTDLAGGTGPVAVDLPNGTLRASIPLSEIGGATNVDVFAASNEIGTSASLGEGDRCPDYGTFNTSERRVVLRRPAVTQSIKAVDPPGDDSFGGTQDFRELTLTTIGDQFTLAMSMGDTFGIGSGSSNDGPQGGVSVDSDLDLMTGWDSLGAGIPTWGGDVFLTYWIGNVWVPLNSFYLQVDRLGSKEAFGYDDNDGWWRVRPASNTLVMGGSVSMLDGVRRGILGGVRTGRRVATDGRMAFRAETWPSLQLADAVPEPPGLLDSLLGVPLAPYMWDPARTVTASDPAEFGAAGDADIVLLEAQVLDGNLVLRGTLGVWMATESKKTIDVALDLDVNAATGAQLSNPPDGSAIGVDAIVSIEAVDAQSAVVYTASLYAPMLTVLETVYHDAWVSVKTNTAQRLPGWFTLTIPLRALPVVGSRVQLYAITGYTDVASDIDIAPPQPMDIWLTPRPTLQQAARALAVAGGLLQAAPGDSALDVKAPAGLSVLDAVTLARLATSP